MHRRDFSQSDQIRQEDRAGEIRKCLNNLSNTDQTFLPSNDLVLWLLGREELMTIDEHLDFIDSHETVELESERVWPVHPLIHY